MKFNQLIQEALPISTVKPFMKAWDPNFHKEVFERQPRKDKKAYRIYLPLEAGTSNDISIPTAIQTYLQTAIPGKPYTTDAENYMQGLAFEVSNPTRKLGIGKMLSRSESSEKDPAKKVELQGLKRTFDADPQRAATKKPDKQIVISRHPYDVAGMSTDRGWSSCMNLVDGVNRHYVLRDVRQGSIIAYLVNSDDLNIRKPLARILIKPYMEKGNPKNIAMMGDVMYGTAPNNFTTLVDAWVNKNYNQGKGGLYCLGKGLYRDEIPQQMTLYSDDQLLQMSVNKLASWAQEDSSKWSKIVQLRPDADDVLWKIATTYDTKAARLIKHVDFNQFKAAFDKRPQILARLPVQTEEMISYALNKNADYARFIRNRTPAQHAQVNKLLQLYPEYIKSLHNPTKDQIHIALNKDDYYLGYCIKNHAHLLDADYMSQLMRKYRIYYWTNTELFSLIKTYFPSVLQDPQVKDKILRHKPVWYMSNMNMSVEEILNNLKSDKINSYDAEKIITNAKPKFMRFLSSLSPEQISPQLKQAIMRKWTGLAAAIPSWTNDELHAIIKKKPALINEIPDPDPDLFIRAVSKNSEAVNWNKFKAPKYSQAIDFMLNKHAKFIFDIPRPTQDQIKTVLLSRKLKDWQLADLIIDHPFNVTNQVIALKQDPSLIRYIDKPSVAAQLAAVHADPDVYDLIKPKDRAPATRAYVQAYRKEMNKPE